MGCMKFAWMALIIGHGPVSLFVPLSANRER
jgi:hypothetical protein